ncbi:hypothetical protein PN290_01110 [Romboutsia sp. 1001216sp1]|uniref:hypothetical protein n=1 Tax=Romboutsia TaxID=1501226 RepID=UPI000AD228DF|nr:MULTISPECIES: hypothetical protein [Romboutsia]MDB8790443.1 hypothetical protein [Romboutsia sp. 1001216sp1]MDB8794679.1 hypothetical protein [Romboutsia sp. 1001216sp1]MDB8796486.1 hypothetical protein [Romboutsia sp. 1001216sp1]MDB8797964.1 hypothetical protein [Romboutsia sp. 1001216sp1]MDB8801305.1 hypothetical protein [Romboutsia sp. 1001216sp1]
MDIFAMVAAFGGGAFGALIGALPAFILTGVIAIAGAAIGMAGGSDLVVGNVAFGSFLGPHIAFAGGVAAAAYAANKRSTSTSKVTSTGEKILGSDEVESGTSIGLSLNLTGDYKVLLVGGIFGILGFLINYLYASVLVLPTDTPGMTVFTLGVIARLTLGNSGLFGKYDKNKKRKYLSTGKMLGYNIVLGASLGIVVSYVAASLSNTFEVAPEVISLFPTLCFGISALSLIFTQTGSATPATHHITLISALAAVVSGNPIFGVLFGIISCLIGDFGANTLNSNCDSHIDPPAFSIFICTFIINFIF